MKAVFLRALDASDKAWTLLNAITAPEARGSSRFDVDPSQFGSVPGSPFVYWVSERVRRLFTELPQFEGDGRTVKQGLVTTDDFRFGRAWWEPHPAMVRQRWFLFAKGGAFSPFYADFTLCVDWRSNGAQSWAIYDARRDVVGGIVKNPEFYFLPGLTWPHRSAAFSAAPLPAGCIFSQSGKAAFAPPETLDALLGLFNAAVTTLLCRVQSDAVRIKFEVGIVQNLPYPSLTGFESKRVADLARRAWSLKRGLDSVRETSHAFTLPALLQSAGDTLADRCTVWADRVHRVEAELAVIQSEIDQRCFDLYNIDEVDRRTATQGLDTVDRNSKDESQSEKNDDDESDDDRNEEASADARTLTADLVSWMVGVACGRFDVRLATGDQPLPREPGPFDALPVCSPAMLTAADGLPVASAPVDYPYAFPDNGILVDDPGHPRDLSAAVRAVFDAVFGTTADAWWTQVAALLDPKDHDLRAWMASRFFEHHLKRHSKSRRKAPILWQLATPSGRYSVWLYVHRLTRDSFFQLQNDVIAPKVAHEERQLTELVQGAGEVPSAGQRKEIVGQAAVVEELRALLDEVKRVAPLWNPTLDDGVLLAMAPLWRLVPHHKPWQKELKGKWDEVVAAKYDWAHLAMHLAPERVVPKCATDRSLAIAHGLEDVFWVEETVGKWNRRSTPTRPTSEIVREHTSAAVKAALKSLLEAPLATTGGARGRARRTASVATD